MSPARGPEWKRVQVADDEWCVQTELEGTHFVIARRDGTFLVVFRPPRAVNPGMRTNNVIEYNAPTFADALKTIQQHVRKEGKS